MATVSVSSTKVVNVHAADEPVKTTALKNEVDDDDDATTAAPESTEHGGKLDNVSDDLQWAVHTVEEGMQNDDEFAETIRESVGGLVEHPGIHGQYQSAVKTQHTVLENLAKHHSRQVEILKTMKYEDSALGLQCWEDTESIKNDLVSFVRDVLENTCEIDNVLMHMEEGMKYAKMLRKEAGSEKPRNKFLRTYTNRAYEHFKKSEMSDALTQKLKDVETKGIALSHAAKTAASRLGDFCTEYKRLELEKKMKEVLAAGERRLAEQQRLAAERAQLAKDAARWSFWGTCGLVALSVVGVGIATICVAATGGAAAGPAMYMAAHCGAWAAGTLAGGCAIGAVKSGTNYVHNKRVAAEADQEAADAKKKEYTDLQAEIEAREELLREGVQGTVDLCEQLVANYMILAENVKDCGKKTVVVISNLKFACQGVVPIREALETDGDDADELEMVCELVQEIDEATLQQQQEKIMATRTANASLKELALKCYEQYCGLDVGSTLAKEAEDEAH